MKDYLIIGQGLAGSLLAHELIQKQQDVLVIDANHKSASSAIAAGIINPITGRRFVKSWMIDELLPVARKTYKELEELLAVQLMHERPIFRMLYSSRELNDWHSRSSSLGFAPYIERDTSASELEKIFAPAYGHCQIKGSLQIDLPLLIQTFQGYLAERNLLLNEFFDYNELKIKADFVKYKEYKARRIIFCEGARTITNPWFDWLPFEPAKGEVLLIRIPGIRLERIVKHGLIIAPLKDDLYWAGSNYEWKPNDDLPSEKGRAGLLDKIEHSLQVPFEIISHQAAIRPTTKDRRPFLGSHPKKDRMLIFNGLGTKGASLGPYLAKHMQAHLTDGRAISDEVDIKRFMKDL